MSDSVYSRLKNKYEVEIELLCLNSGFMENDKLIDTLNKYRLIQLDVGMDSCLLRESEFHSNENPYYEFSVFCNKEKLKEVIDKIQESGLHIDLIHTNSDSFSLE